MYVINIVHHKHTCSFTLLADTYPPWYRYFRFHPSLLQRLHSFHLPLSRPYSYIRFRNNLCCFQKSNILYSKTPILEHQTPIIYVLHVQTFHLFLFHKLLISSKRSLNSFLADSGFIIRMNPAIIHILPASCINIPVTINGASITENTITSIISNLFFFISDKVFTILEIMSPIILQYLHHRYGDLE